MAVMTPKEPPQIAWKNRRKEDPEARMTFIEHLGELRARLVRSAIAILVGTVISYFFYDMIFAAVTKPLMPVQAHREALELNVPKGWLLVAPLSQMQEATPEDLAAAGLELPAETDAAAKPEAEAEAAPPEDGTPPLQYYVWSPPAEGPKSFLVQPTEAVKKGADGELTWVMMHPLEGFLIQFKLSVLFGIFFASPYIVYQLCAFIFPGLTNDERSLALYALSGSSILSLSGISVAYFLIFPNVLPYLLAWTPPNVLMQLRVNETIPFILKSVLGFAVAFQFPMVVLLLVYFDLMTPQALKQHRRMAIVIVFIVSAVLTPPDPGSMLMMAIPLLLLYEVSILLSYLVVVRRRKKAAA